VTADPDATAVESAVLATDPGVRDYTKRLEALKKKNPFVQQFSSSPETGGALADQEAEVTGATAGTETTADAGLGEPVGGAESFGGGSDDTSADESSDTTSAEPTPEVQTQTRFYAPRVDVTFGQLGNAKQYEDVRYFDFLPDEKTAVVAFLGLGESADKAVFAVSNEVTESSGDGSCAPHGVAGCELLILRIGEQRTLKIEGEGEYAETKTFRLKVLDTNFERIPDPRDSDSGDESSAG
jgi:hypothetical protein